MLDANTQGRALRYIGPLILVVSLILAGMTSSVVYAQRPGEDVYLVKDIRPGPEDSWPVGLTEMNGRLFFGAGDTPHGFELWASDGRVNSTALVKDIAPGLGSSWPSAEQPDRLTKFNGRLFFSADDGSHGYELWASDGTAGGTLMVKDINPSDSSWPGMPTEVNGRLFFNASDGTHGGELWTSDGTAGGTVLLKDINPSGDSLPVWLTQTNGRLFFTADDHANGRELWTSDGTAGGTLMVRDINPGSGSSGPQGLITVNGRLFFCADDGTHGIELWSSDGTAGGTVMVKDINPGPASSCVYNLREPWARGSLNGTLFFQANDGPHGWELWRSDGTASGTVMVKDINPGPGSSGPGTPTEVNGRLFFSAGDGTHGGELWTSDGTAGGTLMVRDINPGSGSSGPQGLVVANGRLIFNANDGTHGVELWSSDGTARGTVMVKDINPGSGNSWPAGKTEVNGRLFFRADDGVRGFELWAVTLPPGPTTLMTLWGEINDRTSSITWEAVAEATWYKAEPDLLRSSVYAQEGPTNYYVDSVGGSDANSGTSEAEAWSSFAPVHSHSFQPGDVIHFKRGSTWSGGLVIDDSGVAGNPIVFKAYGSIDLPRPIISYYGDWDTNRWSSAIEIYADWVVVEDFLVRDAHQGGVHITEGSEHNVVRNIEATAVGSGVVLSGQNNLVTESYLHDLKMIYNTPGGDDDWGAVGVEIYSSNNEILYNTMENCIADSYDYGVDGGAVEIYGIVNNNYVHHNWAVGNDGFLEVAGSRKEGTCHNNTFAHNVSFDSRARFSYLHLAGGRFGCDVQNLQVNNNTIYETVSRPYTTIFAFSRSPGADAFKIRNNVIYAAGPVSDETGFTHDHNLYYLTDGSSDLGFSLGEGERIADPLFVDVNAEPKPDFRLDPGSPAIDAGVDLGYSLDHDDKSIPAGVAPDVGAYEYQFPAPVNEIIIDDADDANFTTSSTNPQEDAWQLYTEVGGQHYGDTHYYNTQIGDGDTATWSFTVPEPDSYRVYAWWWEGPLKPDDVPYTISHQGGATVVYANQQVNGGQWNLLGAFDFESAGSVMVSDDVSAGQDIVADAIRLVPNQPPVANITYSCTLATCDFDASGSFDLDGPIDSYVWDFGDGNTGSGITTSHTYDESTLGTYSVDLTVTDDAGAAGGTDVTLNWTHIGDLDAETIMLERGDWQASVIITVHDVLDDPVEKAKVTGIWTIGGYSPTAQCTTDTTGQCVVSTESLQKRYEYVKFTVEDVTYAPPYIPGNNQDPDGDSDGTIITVFKNTPPTVNITAPADGSTVAGTVTVQFDATDAEDAAGTLTVEWNVDGGAWQPTTYNGVTGYYEAIWDTTAVGDGRHTLNAQATDSDGASGSDSADITVGQNTPPTVNITAPGDGATFASGATIDFAGTASDAEDGDVTASLVWTSDIDGQIGAGGSFSAVLSDGVHTITATATDSVGASGSDSAGITVGQPPTMHVGDLDGVGQPVRSKWEATVTITVHDQDHNPLANTNVAGTWKNGAQGGAECTTDGSGQCIVAKGNLKFDVTSVTFAVDGVTLTGYGYAPDDNHEDDVPPDSDGTSITVGQPQQSNRQ